MLTLVPNREADTQSFGPPKPWRYLNARTVRVTERGERSGISDDSGRGGREAIGKDMRDGDPKGESYRIGADAR
jgi:hypothetical protein